MVQQLAYTLAHVNEYFNRIPVISQPMVIEVEAARKCTKTPTTFFVTL
jgi:hypothetical protein